MRLECTAHKRKLHQKIQEIMFSSSAHDVPKLSSRELCEYFSGLCVKMSATKYLAGKEVN
jgi:hypothetical protein